jgi:hypothetical protein
MGYIGSQPATNFETVRKQVSTTNSGTTITLDYSVSSVQDILVTVNAVVQSYDNYSVSGTTLTLGGTLNNDRVEILYVGRTFQTVTPAVGTVTNEMLSGSIANSKLANSSITLNGSSVSLGGSASVDNTPIFRAGLGTSPTLSTGADTFITFTNEIIDTDSAYDTSNGRFTVPTGGKYFIHAQLKMNTSVNFNMFDVNIFKNTTAIAEARHYHDDNGTVAVSLIVDASVGDYFRARGMQNSGSNQSLYTHERFSYFEGFKLL